MFIAYLDDSDTKQKSVKWQVMSAVIIKDSQFRELEINMAVAVETLLPEEKRDQFEEFHACELYGGHGIFDGIEQARRFAVVEGLLHSLQRQQLPVVYGAVNLQELGKLLYASADPMDVAFRICAEGIDTWISEWLGKHFRQLQQKKPPVDADELLSNDMAILIADDCDGKTKATIQRSFRNMRKRFRPPDHSSRLKYVHDDMYFGDSKFSVGIQLADLCSYFIARHLQGDDEIDFFYKLIEPHIVFSRLEPINKAKQGV